MKVHKFPLMTHLGKYERLDNNGGNRRLLRDLEQVFQTGNQWMLRRGNYRVETAARAHWRKGEEFSWKTAESDVEIRGDSWLAPWGLPIETVIDLKRRHKYEL